MGIKIAKNLVSDNILDYIDLSSDYSIFEIYALDKWVGKSLKELDMRSKYGINVIAIKNGLDIDVSIDATEIIKEKDIIVVIGHNDDLKKIENR